MNVILKTDGREFDAFDDYEPGDAAWFGTEVLLIVSVHNGQAEAIVHPEARAMLQAAMSGPRDDGGSGMAEAMRIHGRAGWQRAMAVCPHPEEDVAPLSGDAWMCVGCGQDVVQSTATDEKIDAAIAEADPFAGMPEAERLRIIGAATVAGIAARDARMAESQDADAARSAYGPAHHAALVREVAAYRAQKSAEINAAAEREPK